MAILVTGGSSGLGRAIAERFAVDGNDVFAVHDAAREAVAHLRRGNGPFFLECTTYRWREHVGPLWDHDKGYRTKAEVDSWVVRCPIRRASERLVGDGACTPAAIEAMERASQAEVDDAVDALSSLMEPVIMVVLGTLIGGMVIAMYLPIFKLGQAV